MKSDIRRFIIRLAIFLIPLYIVVAFYLISDPFMVIYHYSNFFSSGKPNIVGLNKDYVSVETFLNNNPRYHYDSFIFGSSRSMFYKMADWEKYIDSKKCFHFDASKETVFGVNRKMRLLDNDSVKIRNALFVIDREFFSNTTNSKGNLYIKHPLLTGQNSFLYQFEFFKVFIDYKFLIPYVAYRITGKPNGLFGALDGRIMNSELETNEISFPETDNFVEMNPKGYYTKHAETFYKRDSVLQTSPVVIKKGQRVLLEEMSSILKKDSTHYKIVISPLYDQIKFNPEDEMYIDSLFGKENVFDFSGINEITNSRYNYYETEHYRPSVARWILHEVYTGAATDSLSQK